MNYRHINFAQQVLHNQFPHVEGLGYTLLQGKERSQSQKIGHGLQIIFDKGNHWIVASNIGCDVGTIYKLGYVVGGSTTFKVQKDWM